MAPLTRPEAEIMLKKVDGAWSLNDTATPSNTSGQATLSRDYKFKDFKESMIFVNRVAALAEAEGHHPDIVIKYNKVRLDLTTHAIKGLSINDFILAAKIDAH